MPNSSLKKSNLSQDTKLVSWGLKASSTTQKPNSILNASHWLKNDWLHFTLGIETLGVKIMVQGNFPSLPPDFS